MGLDMDLQSIQEARDLLRTATQAQIQLAQLPETTCDNIVQAMAETGKKYATRLAELAVKETGFGVVKDKITKNLIAAERVFQFIKNMKVLGILSEDTERGIIEIGAAMGVVVAIIPSTNPTSTTIYKALIAVKSGNAVVFSPHPAAKNCIAETITLLMGAAEKAGAPKGLLSCLSNPTREATQELMSHRLTSVILATGGTGLVKAAYSSGKPAFGVGPGNVPAYIERSAHIAQAVSDIIESKTFDNGTICASEQAVVTEHLIRDQVKQEFIRKGAHFLTPNEIKLVSKALVLSKGGINPRLVGQSAHVIANQSGFSVPENTPVLIAELDGVGPDYPLSCEKLSTVLAFYSTKDWHEACDMCLRLLAFGGIGHSLVIHSQNNEIIREFGLRKPVVRILVNTPSSQGAVGATTSLAPALTLGCGTWGNNITADNVTPLHLINRKRIAFDRRAKALLQEQTPNATEADTLINEAMIRAIVQQVIGQKAR